MNIAVCDDSVLFRQQILDFLKAYSLQNGEQSIFVSAFSNAEDLLDSVKKNADYQICLLDIIMPGMNGIELGKSLREIGFDGKIIYLTSSEEFAVDSYKVKAFNYILKPFSKEDFLLAFDEAVKSFSSGSEKSLVVKTKQGPVKIVLGNIMYAELSHRNIVYHLTGGKIIESVSLRTTFAEATQELIHDSRFALCGAGMIVNLYHITAVEVESLIFCDTYKIFPSKKSCREIRSLWADYLFSKEGKI